MRRPRRNHKRHAQCACRRTVQIRVAPVRRQLPRIPPAILLRPLQSRHRQAIIIRPIRRIRIQHCPARRIYSHLNIHRRTSAPVRPRIIRASASVSDTFIFAARSSCDDPRDPRRLARFEHLRRRLVTLYDFPLRPLTPACCRAFSPLSDDRSDNFRKPPKPGTRVYLRPIHQQRVKRHLRFRCSAHTALPSAYSAPPYPDTKNPTVCDDSSSASTHRQARSVLQRSASCRAEFTPCVIPQIHSVPSTRGSNARRPGVDPRARMPFS